MTKVKVRGVCAHTKLLKDFMLVIQSNCWGKCIVKIAHIKKNLEQIAQFILHLLWTKRRWPAKIHMLKSPV